MIYGVQQAAQFVLRPLEIKHIYDFAIRLYRARFAPMFLSMALVQLPMSLVSISMTLILIRFQQETIAAQNKGETPGMDWLYGQADQLIWVAVLVVFVMAYLLLVFPLGNLTCARLASTTLLGEEESLAEAFRYARRRYWPTQVALATFVLPLLALAVLILLIVVLAMAAGSDIGVGATAVIGIFLIMMGMLATWVLSFRFFPALMGVMQCAEEPEGYGIFAQGLWYLKRSYSLTQGYFMRILGLSILLYFAAGFIQRGVTDSVQIVYELVKAISTGEASADKLLAQVSSSQSDVTYLAVVVGTASIVSLLFPALMVCFQTLLYYDLRCRKEGFDLLQMLRGQGTAAGGFDSGQSSIYSRP
jgi:hypothetical protein